MVRVLYNQMDGGAAYMHPMHDRSIRLAAHSSQLTVKLYYRSVDSQLYNVLSFPLSLSQTSCFQLHTKSEHTNSDMSQRETRSRTNLEAKRKVEAMSINREGLHILEGMYTNPGAHRR